MFDLLCFGVLIAVVMLIGVVLGHDISVKRTKAGAAALARLHDQRREQWLAGYYAGVDAHSALKRAQRESDRESYNAGMAAQCALSGGAADREMRRHSARLSLGQ
jgi:hypothetical protein